MTLVVHQLFSAQVRNQHGLPGGSSVHKAVETVTLRGLLVRDGGSVVFDSPFFPRSVRTEVAADLG